MDPGAVFCVPTIKVEEVVIGRFGLVNGGDERTQREIAQEVNYKPISEQGKQYAETSIQSGKYRFHTTPV